MLPTVCRSAAMALLLGSLSLGALAQGLFDDKEARKAIVDLRARVVAMDEAGQARDAELATRTNQLTEQLAALRRSLLELNNQLEAMRGDLAKLRGADEQLARDLAEYQRRQQDVGQAMDERLRQIEPVKMTLDGREFVASQDEKRGYDEAINAIRSGDFDKSVEMLKHFQRRFPVSGFGDSARFWLGNALYGKRAYREAVAAFKDFLAAAPDHPRAPEAMLAMANSQAEMKDPRSARKTIGDLIKAFPESEAAQAGKERLASIR